MAKNSKVRSLLRKIRSAQQQIQQQRNSKKGLARILSPPITRVSFGGTLNLECVVNEEFPLNIWWWINGTKLNLDLHRGGVYIERLKQRKSQSSKLSLAGFTHTDAGLYECRASKEGFGTPPSKSSVQVTVVDPTKAPFSDYDEECDDYSNAKTIDVLKHSLFLSFVLLLIS